MVWGTFGKSWFPGNATKFLGNVKMTTFGIDDLVPLYSTKNPVSKAVATAEYADEFL